jgi:hypothetical protein
VLCWQDPCNQATSAHTLRHHTLEHKAKISVSDSCLAKKQITVRFCLQEKYKISASGDTTFTDLQEQQRSSSSTATSAAARAALLQHLAGFRQRATAIKSSADAVQAWHSQQQGAAAAAVALPAEVLMVLNREAEKGLLHMLQGRASC